MLWLLMLCLCVSGGTEQKMWHLTPDPKCSNLILIKASSTDSPRTWQSVFVSAEKIIKQISLT